jgi:polyhydroxyalkanoate synthesis regulator phasin
VAQIDGLRRYIEAATTLTQVTRGRAEEIVRELVASGEVERNRAQDWIEDLIKRSREASETLVTQVSSEVERQLGERFKDLDLDDLAKRVAGMIEMAGALGRSVTTQARDRVVPGRSTGPSPTGPAPGPKSEKGPKQKKNSSKPGGPKKDSAKTAAKTAAKKKDKDGSSKEASPKKASAKKSSSAGSSSASDSGT